MPEPEEDPPDLLPRLIAEIDQALEIMPQQARIARGAYRAFRNEGFDKTAALYLTAVAIRGTGPSPNAGMEDQDG